jgi:excinuclease ABC subunit B
VALVAILDADKAGYLRSYRSLIQTCGRAARNPKGRVIFYAEKLTDSIRAVLEETRRRRALQHAYNTEHGITPRQIVRAVAESLYTEATEKRVAEGRQAIPVEANLPRQIKRLEQEMIVAAKALDFERAAELRDAITYLKQKDLGVA